MQVYWGILDGVGGSDFDQELFYKAVEGTHNYDKCQHLFGPYNLTSMFKS